MRKSLTGALYLFDAIRLLLQLRIRQALSYRKLRQKYQIAQVKLSRPPVGIQAKKQTPTRRQIFLIEQVKRINPADQLAFVQSKLLYCPGSVYNLFQKWISTGSAAKLH